MYAEFDITLVTGNDEIDGQHKEKHDEFRKVVEELHEMLEEEEGPSEKFVEAVQKNVVDWLYKHIRTYDCSVATYMNMKLHPDLV